MVLLPTLLTSLRSSCLRKLCLPCRLPCRALQAVENVTILLTTHVKHAYPAGYPAELGVRRFDLGPRHHVKHDNRSKFFFWPLPRPSDLPTLPGLRLSCRTCRLVPESVRALPCRATVSPPMTCFLDGYPAR